jgi:aminopeptidase S
MILQMAASGPAVGSSMRGALILLLAAAGVTAALAAGPPEATVTRCSSALLPPDFSDRAYSHIVSIVAASSRPASSEGERKVAAYVRDQFQRMGLRTVVEEFEFGSYEIENMQLRVGGSIFRPVSVAFNPYAGVFRFEGLASLVDPQEVSSGSLPDIEDHYVIASQPADFFQLMLKRPKLLVFVDPFDFGKLKASAERRFELKINGRPARYKSANVIGEVAGSSGVGREIILSAHLDAYKNSPGASDNGSGLGVLIELAGHFKTIEGRLNTRIKFVAFGAEEFAVLGSRAYVLRHAKELRECALNFNIDTIGGPTGPFVQTLGGVTGIPARAGENLFPPDIMSEAWEGVHSNWRLLDLRLLSAMQASNHPDWLKRMIEESASALGTNIVPSGNSGSDELSFTQAGVAATAVGYGGGPYHSPEDTVGQVRKENLAAAGTLAACVVETMGTGSTPRQPPSAGPEKDSHDSPGERIGRIVAAISAGADSAQRRSAILRRLDELNVKYRSEDFCSESGCGINVLVEPDRPRAKTLMLGAHYDRASKGKGAVDDAAGVAAVLELLAAFKNKPLGNLALAAAFFDLEEPGLIGSKAYVSGRPQRHTLPAFYLNFDVFAYGDTLWVMSTGNLAAAEAMRTAAAQQKFAVTMEDQAPPGDDQTFREVGVVTLGLGLVPQIELESIHRVVRGETMTTAPSLMKIVHTEEDTPEKVKGEEVARALRVVEAAIRVIDAVR